MFTVLNTFKPALGKNRALEAVLEERVRMRQSQGLRANLIVAAFSPVAPAFRIAFQFGDLAGVEAFRARQREEQDKNPAFNDPLEALQREQTPSELWEVLVPIQPMTSPPRYILRITTPPAIGKARELAALTSARARARQAEGVPMTMSAQVAGPSAGSVATVGTFGGLAELEKMRAEVQDSAASKTFVEQVAPLSSAPATFEIFEVRVPYPPAE